MAVFWSWLWGFQLHHIRRHLLLLHCRSCRPAVVQSVLLVVLLLLQHPHHPRHQECVVPLRGRHHLQPHIRRFLRLRLQLCFLLCDYAVGQLLPRLPLHCRCRLPNPRRNLLRCRQAVEHFFRRGRQSRRHHHYTRCFLLPQETPVMAETIQRFLPCCPVLQ